MKKRLLALILAAAMLAGMTASFGLSALADTLSQAQKNERSSVGPKDSNGEYQINARWNHDEAGFTDETLIEDTTSDSYINRISRSDTMWGTGLSYMMLETWGGSTSSTAKNTDYTNENVWYQWDFGTSSKVTSISYWTSYYNDWVRTTYPQNIDKYFPKHIKVKWSDDSVSWSEKDFRFDYNEPGNEWYEAYCDIKENGADSSYLSQFPRLLSLDFGEPVRARYFRLVFVNPSYEFAPVSDPDSTETYSFETYGLGFYDTSAPDWPGGGAGTETNPFLISNAEQLAALYEYSLNSRVALANTHFRLTDNIDMYGYDWTPVGTSSVPFTGHFDGNGKVISNISVGSEASRSGLQHIGLFGVVGSGAVIENLGVSDVTIYANSGDDPRYGGMTGVMTGGEISNCFVKNVYISNSGIGVSGGFVGDVRGGSSKISNCYVAGTNFLGNSRNGGFVGDSAATCLFSDCYAIGFTDIGASGSNYNTNHHGGFAGTPGGSFSNCYYNYSGATALTIGDSAGRYEAKTSDEFADGTVCGLLNSGEHSLGTVWVQNEGDLYPHQRVFDTGSSVAEMEFTVRDNLSESYELTGTYHDDGGCWSLSNINDNNINTNVYDSTVRAITMDLGEGIYGSVSKIVYSPYSSTNWWFADQCDGALLQGSNDDILYETIAVTSGTVQGENTIILDEPTMGYRYLRWVPAEGKTPPIAELHWYGQYNSTVSYYGDRLELNTRYTVKNTYDTDKEARAYIALYVNDELVGVESATESIPAQTAGKVVAGSSEYSNPGAGFTLKTYIWENGTIKPLGASLERDYMPYVPETEFTLPNYFCDSMVLQRGKVINIFGKAWPNTPITATLDKGSGDIITGSTAADNNGDWRVTLDPQTKGGPYTLTVSSPNQTEVISNVYIGEVFICSGQSNMEFNYNNWGSSQDPDFINEIEDNDRIKFLTGASAVNSNQGERFDIPLNGLHGWGPLTQWATCTASNARGLSEVGYKVAKELTEAEDDLYVGLIGIAVGGAPIEPWQEGGTYYEALLAPFKGYNIGAFLWYQGESNAPGTYWGERWRYVKSMADLINTYRTIFEDEDLPFLYVQLARHIHWPDTVYLQDEQRRVLTSPLVNNLSNIGMVVSIDTDKGSGAHPDQNTAIHPGGKAIVGERMAELYKKYVWGQTELVTSGPLYESSTVDGSSILVKFSEVADGLTIKDVDNGSFDYSPDNSALLGLDTVSEFEIAGSDKQFVPATAEIISKDTVKVYSDAVTEPMYVRYASSSAYPLNPSLANSYTSDGETKYLPASPFTTEFDN